MAERAPPPLHRARLKEVQDLTFHLGAAIACEGSSVSCQHQLMPALALGGVVCVGLVGQEGSRLFSPAAHAAGGILWAEARHLKPGAEVAPSGVGTRRPPRRLGKSGRGVALLLHGAKANGGGPLAARSALVHLGVREPLRQVLSLLASGEKPTHPFSRRDAGVLRASRNKEVVGVHSGGQGLRGASSTKNWAGAPRDVRHVANSNSGSHARQATHGAPNGQVVIDTKLVARSISRRGAEHLAPALQPL